MADDRRRGGDRSRDRSGRPPAKRSGGSSRAGASRGASGSGSAKGGSGRSGGGSGSGGSSRAGGAARQGASGGRGQGGRGQGGRGQGGRGQGAGRGRDDRRERDDAPKRGGGFGPYRVDSRDEETRERRNRRSGPEGERGDDRGGRPALRTVGQRPDRSPKSTSGSRKPRPTAPARRRRKRGPADVQQEIGKLAGRNANRALGTLMAAADAFSHDREREALRILRPLREQLPESPSVRELTGLVQYRLGNYAAAAKELEAYADLSDAVDQNPVLMDCYRAQHRWRKVEDLWNELAAVSPSAELVTEGRIVYAGAL